MPSGKKRNMINPVIVSTSVPSAALLIYHCSDALHREVLPWAPRILSSQVISPGSTNSGPQIPQSMREMCLWEIWHQLHPLLPKHLDTCLSLAFILTPHPQNNFISKGLFPSFWAVVRYCPPYFSSAWLFHLRFREVKSDIFSFHPRRSWVELVLPSSATSSVKHGVRKCLPDHIKYKRSSFFLIPGERARRVSAIIQLKWPLIWQRRSASPDPDFIYKYIKFIYILLHN